MKRAGIIAFLIVVVGLARVGLADDSSLQVQQATALANALEQGLNTGNAALVNSAADWKDLLQNATDGIAVPPGFREQFIKAGSAGIAEKLIKMNSNMGGQYHLLRVRQNNGQTSAVFRMLSKASALSYSEWYLGTDAAGQPAFVDAYFAVSGERLSQTERRMYMLVATRANPASPDAGGLDDATLAGLQDLIHFQKDLLAREFSDAVYRYDQLPPELRNEKAIMVQYIGATMEMRAENPQEYIDAMKAFEQRFPGDPAADLLCLDERVMSGEYEEALASADRLGAYFGGDAYLLSLKAGVDVTWGQQHYTAARELYEESIKEEPTLAAPYWGLVSLSLKEQDYDQTVVQLNRITKALNLKLRNLETLPAYSDFVQSDAYRKWKDSLGAPAASAAN